MREGVTNGTGAGKHLTLLAYMAIVMTSKTPWPVAVTDVVGIGRPVYLHGGEDVPLINREDRGSGLVNLGFLILEDVREVFGVVPFNKLPDFLIGILLVLIVFHQGI